MSSSLGKWFFFFLFSISKMKKRGISIIVTSLCVRLAWPISFICLLYDVFFFFFGFLSKKVDISVRRICSMLHTVFDYARKP